MKASNSGLKNQTKTKVVVGLETLYFNRLDRFPDKLLREYRDGSFLSSKNMKKQILKQVRIVKGLSKLTIKELSPLDPDLIKVLEHQIKSSRDNFPFSSHSLRIEKVPKGCNFIIQYYNHVNDGDYDYSGYKIVIVDDLVLTA